MTAPTLVQLEQAIVQRLSHQVRPAGPFRRVASYGGELAKLVKGEGLDGPLALVFLDSAEEARHSSSTYSTEVEFHVFVAATNYRGEAQARVGVGDSEPGAYQLIETVRELLAGQDLGLEIRPIEPRGWHSVTAPEQALSGNAAVYRYDFAASWVYPRPVAPETPEGQAALPAEAGTHASAGVADHESSRIYLDSDGDGEAEIETEVEHS